MVASAYIVQVRVWLDFVENNAKQSAPVMAPTATVTLVAVQ